MASNDILDAELRREANRERFANFLSRSEISPTTQSLSRSIPRIISDYNFQDMTKAELNQLTVAIRKEFTGEWSLMWGAITDQLNELALVEGEATKDIYEDFTDDPLVAPTNKRVEAATKTAVMTLTTDVVQSGTWSQFVKQNESTTMSRINGVIRNGYNNGSTNQEVVQELRGRYNRQTKKYEGGLLNGKARAGADSLARTGTSHFANVARDEFATANKDVIQGRTLFATLDNRTTTICFGRHLNFYPTGEKFPPLPFHFGERSQYIFKTKGFDPLNTERTATGGQDGEAAKEGFEEKQSRTDKKVKYKGKKDNEIFDIQTIDAKLSSDKWLRRQPKWFIESTLGKERAKLFTDGDLSIDKFTDITGKQLTLDELKQTNAGDKAYRKANK